MNIKPGHEISPQITSAGLDRQQQQQHDIYVGSVNMAIDLELRMGGWGRGCGVSSLKTAPFPPFPEPAMTVC